MSSALKILWTSFLKTQGWVLSISALLLFLLPVVVPSTFSLKLTQREIALLAVVGIVHYVFFITVIDALIATRHTLGETLLAAQSERESHQRALLASKNDARPRVIRCLDMYANTANQGELWLILSPSTIYNRDSFVVIHHLSPLVGANDQKLETRVGYGLVENVQADGTVVVKVINKFPGIQDVWSSLQKDELPTKEAISVRPCLFVEDHRELAKNGW